MALMPEIVLNSPAVEEWPISHLRNACAKNGVKGYSKMTKDELVTEVKKLFKQLNAKA